MLNFEELLISLALYDSEDGAGAGSDGAGAGSDGAGAGSDGAGAGSDGAGAGSDGAGKSKPKVFTQDEVNSFLAKEKRNWQSRYEEMESAYKETLETQNLTMEQRKKLEDKLNDLQKSQLSKEQQYEYDKKQLEEKYTKEVKDLQEKSQSWEQRYKSSLLERDLLDAASKHDAWNPSQVVSLLRPMTKIVEETDDEGQTVRYKPVVDLNDIDVKTGNAIITQRTPEEAVKRMQELHDLYGNLFKPNVVSGIGAGSATGSGMSGKGKIDPSKISMEQYMEMRKKDPRALGLK